MSLTHFGTDGIRGAYGSGALNDEIAFRAGRAAGRLIREQLGQVEPCVAVGRDTRASGGALFAAFARGLAVEGGRALDLGVAPTPCVAYATGRSEAHLGCSITASHNPASDNGIKFFSGEGVKPSAEMEQALDDLVATLDAESLKPDAPYRADDASAWRERYLQALLKHVQPADFGGLRVAIDCAHGALFELAPQAFQEQGARLTAIATKPDGSNINDGVGSEHPESLQALYASGEYDCAFAFDGDGDRVILFDEKGQRVSGEGVLAILALAKHKRGALVKQTLVTTVQSNLGLDLALRERGIATERVPVGDKHIVRLMRSKGYTLGGEESGHLVLGGFAITGDGLVAALRLAQIIRDSGLTASELARVYRPFPQRSTALKVVEKRPLDQCAALSDCMQRWEAKLGSRGRLLVRYSGTEPKLRLLVEAGEEETVKESMDALLAAAASDLEVV